MDLAWHFFMTINNEQSLILRSKSVQNHSTVLNHPKPLAYLKSSPNPLASLKSPQNPLFPIDRDSFQSKKEGLPQFPPIISPSSSKRGIKGVIYVQKRESGGDFEKKRGFPSSPLLFPPLLRRGGLRGWFWKRGAFSVLPYYFPLFFEEGVRGWFREKEGLPQFLPTISPSSSKRGIKGVIYVQKRD